MTNVNNNDIGFGPYLGPQRGDVAGDLANAKPGTVIPGGGGTVAAYPTTSTLTIPDLELTTDTFISPITGHLQARVVATWTAPPQPENPNDPNGIKYYDVQHTSLDSSHGWSAGANAHLDHTATISPLNVGIEVLVRVRAETTKGVLGPWIQAQILTVADSTPPPVPSAPTVIGTLRGAAVLWDGLFAGGVPRPADFQYVECSVSLVPDMSTGVQIAGQLQDAGQTATTPVGTAPFTVYARLRARNTSGVYSAYSAIVQGGSIPIIAEDIGQGAVTLGKLATAAVDANAIAQNAVTAFGISDSAITVTKLADLAVTTAKIGDAAINAIKLAANAVTSTSIVDGAVVSAKLADLAITQQKLADAAVITAKISDNAVSNLKLLDGAATTSKIATAAITSDLLAQFAVTAQKVGFGIGGGNQLLNSNYADRGDPASPVAANVVPHWAPESSCTVAVVTSSVVPGTKAVETTFDPNVGQLAGLS